MGNATWGRSWPTREKPAPKPYRPISRDMELEQIRLSAAVHWRRHYSIRPPSRLAVRTIRALLETARANQWEALTAELEGHCTALARFEP